MKKLNLLKTISPFFFIAFSFAVMIILGGVILSLPISLKEGVEINFIDALFTSATSLCVTGLISLKEGLVNTFSTFGIVIIAILVEIGGLGVATLGLLLIILINKKVTMKEQTLIKENFNLTNYSDIMKLFFSILMFSYSIKLIGFGFVFIDFYFIHNMSLSDSILKGLFHTISAFNNAGLDLFGNSSLSSFRNDLYLQIVTSFLIIIGGFGYIVIIDIFSKKLKFKKFLLQTKVVLIFSLFLILCGMLLLYVSEINYENINLLDSYFLSVNSRTCGFETVSLYSLRHSTLLIYMILMFIGGGSGSTAGGIKITTFAIFLAYFRGMITGISPHLFKRNIKDELIKKSFIIVILGLLVFVIGAFSISFIENDVNYIKDGIKYNEFVEGAKIYSSFDFAFEAMSAFSNTGNTTGFTPYFTEYSKFILIVLMYIGRVGPITLAMSFKSNEDKLYRYVSEDIAIG